MEIEKYEYTEQDNKIYYDYTQKLLQKLSAERFEFEDKYFKLLQEFNTFKSNLTKDDEKYKEHFFD